MTALGQRSLPWRAFGNVASSRTTVILGTRASPGATLKPRPPPSPPTAAWPFKGGGRAPASQSAATWRGGGEEAGKWEEEAVGDLLRKSCGGFENSDGKLELLCFDGQSLEGFEQGRGMI